MAADGYWARKALILRASLILIKSAKTSFGRRMWFIQFWLKSFLPLVFIICLFVYLFHRIRKGFPSEARVVSRVLPRLLLDFFPAQEIMNKVIGEFLSSQQPYPELMAAVLLKVSRTKLLLWDTSPWSRVRLDSLRFVRFIRKYV